MVQRYRTIPIYFMVTDIENELIETKMKQYGTQNKGGYIRKMAIDGLVIKPDYSEVKKLTGELGKIGSNVNQIARVANECKHIDEADINEMLAAQERIVGLVNELLCKLMKQS